MHGMLPQHVNSSFRPPADRLVLFVADGLRADRFFEMEPETGLPRAPFLRSVMEKSGRWGVSHSHVPTESRPGHVSLLGGIYEDVSAVAKGWTANPVSFDTVFNHTRHSWGLGSPDIVPMFADSVVPREKMTSYTYNADDEDFSEDASYLDRWVFDVWEKRVLNNESARELLQLPQTMHFLHLLGLDTHGHGFRPNSRQYYANIALVDRGIERVFNEMEKRFPDGRTAYVFTSDHGMSDKGSHGAGDPSETETPLIVWGSGAGRPLADATFDARSPKSWMVEHITRFDVEQADVAPLLATLLGLPVPVNSVGVLPVMFLANPQVYQLEANAKQLMEQVRVKRGLRALSSLWFKESPADTEAQRVCEDPLQARVCMKLCLDALQYYDAYHRTYLYCILVSAMGSWMVYVIVWSRAGRTDGEPWGGEASGSSQIRVFQFVCFCCWSVLHWNLRAPFMYYAYSAVCVFWMSEAFALLARQRGSGIATVIPFVVGIAVAECMVLGFFWRPAYSVLLLIVGLVYWSGILAVGAVFPLIPPDFGTSTPLVVAGLVLCAAAAGYVCQKFRVWVVGLCVASVVVILTGFRVGSWSVLLVSFARLLLLPDKGSVSVDERSGLVFGCVAAVYGILSISYETLFLLWLGAALRQWIAIEESLRDKEVTASYVQIVRCAALYLLFTYVSFFGTGNTGSLSSFEISSTYRFITVFSPFLMGSLLVLKALLPFILVGGVYWFLKEQYSVPDNTAFFSVIVLGDAMALTFFFLVRDSGSWRDIGVSISHYGMANAHILFQLILFVLPWILKI